MRIWVAGLAMAATLGPVAGDASAQARQAGRAAPAISAADRQQGAAAHPISSPSLAGPGAGSQAAFVERIGKRVAVQSGLSQAGGDFTVTTLDSPNRVAALQLGPPGPSKVFKYRYLSNNCTAAI